MFLSIQENIQSEIHSASQATDAGESANTREDIFIKVMGPNKPGRIRCAPRNETIKSYYGDTSSNTTLVSQRYEQAVQEATEAKKRCATMEEQLSKHQNRIDELVSTVQILVNKIQSDVPGMPSSFGSLFTSNSDGSPPLESSPEEEYQV